MKENSKNNYRVYLSPVGGAKRSGFEGSVEKLDTERNLMTPRPLLMTLTSQLDVRANVGGLGPCAGVNPLTDLSRSYLICLSQRGVARGYTGEEGCTDVPEDTSSSPSAGDHPAGVVSTHMCRFEILLRGFVDRATSVRLNFFPIEDLDFEY